MSTGHVVNAKDFNASGSSQQTTGSINIDAAVLTLASGHDFEQDHGIVIRGAGAPHGLAQAVAPTVAAQGTTGGTTYTYSICWTSGNGGWSQASSETTIVNGNATLDTTNFNRITFPAAPAGGTRNRAPKSDVSKPLESLTKIVDLPLKP